MDTIVVPFSYIGSSLYRRRTAVVRGVQVSGIAGSLEQFSAGMSGLVKK